MIFRTGAVLLLAFALVSCQSTPPPAADAKAVTYGDWTVKTGGYVRAEAGAVN